MKIMKEEVQMPNIIKDTECTGIADLAENLTTLCTRIFTPRVCFI
jgi:hypothetical protein